MDDGQLAGHGENCTFGSSVCELWGCRADQGDNRCRIDDASVGLLVLAEREDGMLAAIPDTFDVDVVRQVPDFLRGVDGVWESKSASTSLLYINGLGRTRIVAVHDSGVVEATAHE